MRNKYVVVLSARVHPGEAPSSWIMRGVLEYLTGPLTRVLYYSTVIKSYIDG